MRWIYLSAEERQPARGKNAARNSAASLLGRACPGPLGGLAADGFVVPEIAERGARSGRGALVVGHGRLAGAVIRRLRAEEVQVHAVARDADECEALIAMGVTPHRSADLPRHAAAFDVLISTDPMQIVDVSILAWLPERVVILDLAPPPGGVDYEKAKLFGREFVWAPPTLDAEPDRLDPRAWSQLHAILGRGSRA